MCSGRELCHHATHSRGGREDVSVAQPRKLVQASKLGRARADLHDRSFASFRSHDPSRELGRIRTLTDTFGRFAAIRAPRRAGVHSLLGCAQRKGRGEASERHGHAWCCADGTMRQSLKARALQPYARCPTCYVGASSTLMLSCATTVSLARAGPANQPARRPVHPVAPARARVRTTRRA